MARNVMTLLLVVILLTAFTTVPLYSQGQSSPSGDWIGTLKIQAVELRVVFHIQRSGDGGFTSTLDSPDQSAKGIPVKETVLDGDSLHIMVPSVAGRFDGKILSDTLIEGLWKQGGVSMPLALKPLKEPLIASRPQEPKRPYPYDEEEVTIENPVGNFTLAGTLTLPRGVGPAPAVVLISGSGAQDRDETIFGHKPFLVLADYLTRRGIAVLRCDDRGVGKSKGERSKATSVDFMEDALAALRWLRARAGIDSNRVGFIGHSEGGLIAPMAAARTREVAFIVMLAGPGVRGDSVLIRQAALISRVGGADEKTIRDNNAMQRRLFRILEEEQDTAKAAARLTAVMRETLEAAPDSTRRKDASDSAAIAMQAAQLNSPWFRFFLRYDPRQDLRKLKIPVLALNGEKDLQVSYEQNLPEIEKALTAAGNKMFRVKMLPGLNHLFQSAKTGSITEYGKNEETMSPLALREISDWIKKVTGK